MVAVADQIVAQQDGRLVAAEVIDRSALSPELGFIEHIVVDERGHVDHLDDGGDDGVGVDQFAAGFSGQQDEHGAEHFSAESAHVADERVHAGEVGFQFLME